MPKIAAPISDVALKAFKPMDKFYTVAVGGDGVGGLQIMVFPSGTKVFKLTYHFGGKEKLYTIGKYGEFSLAEARDKAREAKRLIAQGEDPSALKKQNKVRTKADTITFQAIAGAWLALRQAEWSAVHMEDTRQLLNLHVFPAIGEKAARDVGKTEVRAILDSLQAQKKAPTLKKIRGAISQILRYAIDREIPGVEVDWAAQLRGKQYSSPEPKHRAALTTPQEVGALMRAIESYRSTSHLTALALYFSALTFARPGEVRQAEWSEIDLENKLWRIPAGKMKMKQPHLVPLAKRTLEILDELRAISGHKKYLFPAAWGGERPMSEATVLAAIRRMGFGQEEMCAHGFRGMASTLLHENGFNHAWIERQLAHSESNSVSAAYNHSEFLKDRRDMMQWWADYLDQLRQIS
jgi:integrase